MRNDQGFNINVWLKQSTWLFKKKDVKNRFLGKKYQHNLDLVKNVILFKAGNNTIL